MSDFPERPEGLELRVMPDAFTVTREVRCDPCLAMHDNLTKATTYGLTTLGIVGALCADHTQEIGLLVNTLVVDPTNPDAIPTPPELMFG